MRACWACLLAPALLSCGASLNQTTVTCPPGRTFLDGVCVSEAVADYVACVRAQGAQLGAEKAQKLSADVSTLGVRAAGAAQVSESLQKKYSASDQAMLAIIAACNGAAKVEKRAEKLAARWTFDEASGSGVADASGNGNTGVVHGAAAWVSGRVGGAIKLDGAEDILVDDNPSQHAARAITVTAWLLVVQKKTDNPWRTVVMKSDPKGSNWWGCSSLDGKEPSPCDEREYGLVVNSDELYVSPDAVTEDRYQNGGHVWCNTAPGSLQPGRWHHVAASMSPASRAIRVYVDGSLRVTCPLSEAGMRRTSHPLHVGSGFVGMLDDVRLYGGELSDADIAALAKPE